MLRRLLALRRLPMFAGADLAELVMVAENLVESSFARGQLVAAANTRLSALHVVVDGRIEMKTAPPRIWARHQALGVLEVLARRELPAPATAQHDTRTLHLGAVEFGEILEDNFGLLSSMLRTLAARVRGLDTARLWPTMPLALARSPYGLVERMIVLRQQVPFLAARMQALAILAHGAREVVWPSAEIVVRAGEPTQDVYIVVEGAMIASRTGTTPHLLGPGTAVGALEALAGLPQEHTIEATKGTRAVTLSSSAIFDVLEDHTELGLATIATFAAALLDAAAALDAEPGHLAAGTMTESNS